MNTPCRLRQTSAGFTLVELLCVLVVVSILLSLTAPSYQKILRKADSTKCASNLRQIGIAVNLATIDNDGKYPVIETDPTDPVYPADQGAKSLAETLAPYGIDDKTHQCPSDLRVNNRFLEKGSSYEWRPFLDDEPLTNPEIIGRFGARVIRPSYFRLVIDIDPIHNGRQNRLYADGHVRSY